MVWEYLSENGWVDFTAATEMITVFFARGQTRLAADDPAALAVSDLMHLNAAEADLPTAAAEDRLQTQVSGVPFYLLVSADAARFAINSTDSGPFVGHDPRQARNFWDVTLFSSDASKLAWLAGTDSLETLRERFKPAVMDLAGFYRGAEDQFGSEALQRFRDAFAVQATLWRAKMAVLLEEEAFADRLVDVYRTLTTSF
jgi:hypothetical protein